VSPLPPRLIGMKACVGAHDLTRKLKTLFDLSAIPDEDNRHEHGPLRRLKDYQQIETR
jgi:hypothetical protein